MGDKIFILELVNHSQIFKEPISLKFYYQTYKEAHENLLKKIKEAKNQGFGLIKKDSFISEFACRLDRDNNNYVEYRIARQYVNYD